MGDLTLESVSEVKI